MHQSRICDLIPCDHRVLADIRAAETPAACADQSAATKGSTAGEASFDALAGHVSRRASMDVLGSLAMRPGRPVAEARLPEDDMEQDLDRMLAESDPEVARQHDAPYPQRSGTRVSISSNAGARPGGDFHAHVNGGHTNDSDRLMLAEPRPPSSARNSTSNGNGRSHSSSPRPTTAQQAVGHSSSMSAAMVPAAANAPPSPAPGAAPRPDTPMHGWLDGVYITHKYTDPTLVDMEVRNAGR
jgi:hypothetical protein